MKAPQFAAQRSEYHVLLDIDVFGREEALLPARKEGGEMMKREHCNQCGELVWIEDDVRPRWKPSRDCPNCASRVGIERLRAETGPERSSRKEAEAA